MTYTYHETLAEAQRAVQARINEGRRAYAMQLTASKWEVRSW